MSKEPKTDDIPDIFITPAMIEAGRAELADFNEDFESREAFLERLYEAMHRASKSDRFPTSSSS